MGFRRSRAQRLSSTAVYAKWFGKIPLSNQRFRAEPFRIHRYALCDERRIFGKWVNAPT